MRARRRAALALTAALPWLVGGSCGGGSGGGGSRAVVTVEPSSPQCTPLPGAFPPGLDFPPGRPGRVLVANFSPPALIPYDAGAEPPRVASAGPVPALPADSDGDGRDEGCAPPACASAQAPLLDGVLGLAPDLALATASGYEELLFVDPDTGHLVPLEVATPAALPATAFALLPAPGTSALRTGASTFACADFPPGALDSGGVAVSASPRCAAGQINTRYTAGAAYAGGRVFVAMSDVGANPGAPDTRYLPGVVLVFDLDLAATPRRLSPHPTQYAIVTGYYNPTDVTRVVTPGGRELVLVTSSGPLGLRLDDPTTPELEGGGIALGDAAIEVIDPALPALVAEVPLGPAGLAEARLAVDAGGRVAFSGSAIARNLYGIDLAALDAIPAAPTPPVVLDGSDPAAGNADARIFDAAHPLRIPARPGGAPAASCPGFTVAAGFDASGTRLYASEFCDGTLGVVSADLSPGPTPLPRSRFRALRATPVADPVGAASLGRETSPGAIAIRPGVPGVDFTGADVFFLLGTPEGELCAVAGGAL